MSTIVVIKLSVTSRKYFLVFNRVVDILPLLQEKTDFYCVIENLNRIENE